MRKLLFLSLFLVACAPSPYKFGQYVEVNEGIYSGCRGQFGSSTEDGISSLNYVICQSGTFNSLYVPTKYTHLYDYKGI